MFKILRRLNQPQNSSSEDDDIHMNSNNSHISFCTVDKEKKPQNSNLFAGATRTNYSLT